MKPIIFCFIGVIGLLTKASAQETMQFTFIGSVGGTHDTIILTSATDLKMNGVEVRYMDQRTFDTLKSYILRNWLENRGKVAPPKNGTPDTLDSRRDIEVTGVDSLPLYFSKGAYYRIFLSAISYLENVGLSTPNVNFVLLRLRFLGNKAFFYRHIEETPRTSPPH